MGPLFLQNPWEREVEMRRKLCKINMIYEECQPHLNVVCQIPGVILAYMLVEYFGLSTVAIGVTLGWICMIEYEARQYLKVK